VAFEGLDEFPASLRRIGDGQRDPRGRGINCERILSYIDSDG
jgi:hypothetical protein